MSVWPPSNITHNHHTAIHAQENHCKVIANIQYLELDAQGSCREKKEKPHSVFSLRPALAPLHTN